MSEGTEHLPLANIALIRLSAQLQVSVGQFVSVQEWTPHLWLSHSFSISKQLVSHGSAARLLIRCVCPLRLPEFRSILFNPSSWLRLTTM